ncbi:MAG: divalent metal cation transporter [Halieaceae bacterium]|nr:divalent metal cation transporter [Halieaceae bacterium]
MSEFTQLEIALSKPIWQRIPIYIKLSGPGWLQGAMTLGGGSAITSLTIGAVYGYELLWLQPLAMLIGCIMLFALSHQTLSTGQKPYEAMRNYVNPSLAWAWAWAALISSIVWGFSHYSLGAGMLEEIIAVGTSFNLSRSEGIIRDLYLLSLGLFIWIICAYTAWNYGSDSWGVRFFETSIKLLCGLIILCFGWIVLSATINGQISWSKVLAGYVPRSIPTDETGVTTIMAAFGSAVGINMTFVYGYTLLARNWDSKHRELAKFDIILGLVFPYIIVTSLISIAAAGTLYGTDQDLADKLRPEYASGVFVESGIDVITAKLIFSFGILGMVVGSLVMHMLCCGAAGAAIFNWAHNSKNYKLALLLPTPAVLGVFLWSSMGPYITLPVSAVCGALLPIAYIGWFILNNHKEYLKENLPKGSKAVIYNLLMTLCILTVTVALTYSTLFKLGVW